jgi:LEM3 (ligand-effect modulator 3) family / CDC50 family
MIRHCSVVELEWRNFTHFFYFFSTGFKIQDLSNSVVELKVTYDGYNLEDPLCGINNTYNAKRRCRIEFEAPQRMEPPILVHYELTNFHQNHKSYYQSRDAFQLLGRSSKDQTELEAEYCNPLNKLGDIWLNPCGLIANTFFNDIFRLQSGNDANGNPLELLEDGIAWASDLLYKYAQPEGFRMEPCDNPFPDSNGTCDPDCCSPSDSHSDLSWSCQQAVINRKDDNKCYRYHYPDEDITQYLYETYPDVISPLEGVENEHFVVWMRTATLPTFRKLYGYFNEPIKKGEKFVIEVESNYVVQDFAGSKSIVVSTTNIFGGKNLVLGESFIVLGFFCLVVAVLFTLKHWLRPRKLADRRYLHYKED